MSGCYVGRGNPTAQFRSSRSCKLQIRQYLRLAHDCTLQPVDLRTCLSFSFSLAALEMSVVRSCPLVGTLQELRLLVGVKASKGALLFFAGREGGRVLLGKISRTADQLTSPVGS